MLFDFNARFGLGLFGLAVTLLGLIWLFRRQTIFCSWLIGAAFLYVFSVALLASSQAFFRGLTLGVLGVLVPCVFFRWLRSQVTCMSFGGPGKKDAQIHLMHAFRLGRVMSRMILMKTCNYVTPHSNPLEGDGRVRVDSSVVVPEAVGVL